MIPISPQQMMWCSLCSLQGQNIKKGHVNLLIHTDIDSYKNDIQAGMNTILICSLHTFIICQTSNTLYQKGGGVRVRQ